MMWQGVDPVGFILDFADRIYHVDCKDTRVRPHNGRVGVLGSHLPWGDRARLGLRLDRARRRAWEDSFRALDAIGYAGPISVEWEDAGMDRLHGAPEALGPCARCSGTGRAPPSTRPSGSSSPTGDGRVAGVGGPDWRHAAHAPARPVAAA